MSGTELIRYRKVRKGSENGQGLIGKNHQQKPNQVTRTESSESHKKE